MGSTESTNTSNVSKKRKSSIPKLLDGKYFSMSENSKIVAICNACGKPRRGYITSTGNFMDHIKKDHPNLVDEIEQYKKQGCDDDGKTKQHQKLINDMFKGFTMDQVSL